MTQQQGWYIIGSAIAALHFAFHWHYFWLLGIIPFGIVVIKAIIFVFDSFENKIEIKRRK